MSKNFFILFLFNFFCLVIKSQDINPNGYNIFYYDNGVKSSEGTMRDGKADGYWKNYYKNGLLKIEGKRNLLFRAVKPYHVYASFVLTEKFNYIFRIFNPLTIDVCNGEIFRQPQFLKNIR